MGKSGLKSVSVCLSVPLPHLDRAPIYEQRPAGPCHGFTLIELLIAILIVLTLAGIALPLTADYIHQANVVRAISEIRGLEKEIIFFEMERGYYPGGKTPGMLESLQKIGRDQFKDPWGTPYQYRNLAQGPHTGGGKPQFCRRDRSYNPLNYDFDLFSVGPDRQVPTHNQITVDKGADDIVRAANGPARWPEESFFCLSPVRSFPLQS
jgi:general secretion pathway protein G